MKEPATPSSRPTAPPTAPRPPWTAGNGSSTGSGNTSTDRRPDMCSYVTVPAEIAGSAKGPDGWIGVTSASVYFDHPFHAPFEHTLNIDFADAARGPGARVAVELSAD